jgi:hypothetical protein
MLQRATQASYTRSFWFCFEPNRDDSLEPQMNADERRLKDNFQHHFLPMVLAQAAQLKNVLI